MIQSVMRPWRQLAFAALLAIATLLAAPGSAQSTLPPALHSAQPQKATQQFLRFVALPQGAERLDTAVVRYQRGKQTVDLIAAVHVADRPYYAALQTLFARYDRLLFELVKPVEMDARELTGRARHPAAQVESDSGLSSLQRLIKEWLQLEFQLDDIDYRPRNFVHADLDSAAVGHALRAHAGDLLQSLLLYSITDAARLRYGDGTLRLGSMELALAMASADRPRALKRVLGRELAEVDFSSSEFGGLGFGSVLIGDRNAAAMAVLQRELAKKPKQVAIFYGAAHLPDMHKRLLAMGFVRQGEAWLTAWRIGPSAVPVYKIP